MRGAGKLALHAGPRYRRVARDAGLAGSPAGRGVALPDEAPSISYMEGASLCIVRYEHSARARPLANIALALNKGKTARN